MKELFANYNEIIRALWWNQPYASLMLHGKIETRTYPTNVRGKVLICACKKRYDLGTIMTISGRNQFDRMNTILQDGEAAITGKAIAIGDLVDCRRMTLRDADKCFVEFHASRWCWIFENVQAIEPFEIKGKQGWAILDEATKNKIHIIK